MISICFILFLLISILTSSYGQVTCASGWVLNEGRCYLIKPAFSGTWDQCNAYCPTSYPGATMLCVRNAIENDWMISQYGSYYYIGYTDMLPYGGGKGTKQYGWVTGCTSTYTKWKAGQPNNYLNNEDYAAVHPSYGSWYDRGPQDIAFCGCEYTPALTTTPSSKPTTVPSSRPSTAPSSRPTVASSSNSTSSPTATPSFSSSQESVSE
jgi:hypothetical protein